ncbi:hypothetical protein VNO77_03547 [Canavalia gladiata]|uniref:Uncharacterized protein n=1 Tax=Canavalia gladiata TaxID=3824 RepID=A0AAN9MUX0_CANGL
MKWGLLYPKSRIVLRWVTYFDMDSYEKTCLRYAYFACGIVTTYTPGPWVQLLLPSSFRLKFQKSEEFSFLFGSIWHAFVTNSECLEQRHEIPGRSNGTGFPWNQRRPLGHRRSRLI